jgi:MFS family permease
VGDAGEPGILGLLRMREIRAAVLGTFVIMLGFGILSPVLPRYARSFHVGYDAVGVLVAAFSLTRLVSDPFTGWFIGRFGERAVVIAGALIVGASSALAAMAPTYTWLVVFRGAGGAGSAVFFAALLSYLLRTVPPGRLGRVMGVYYASFNIGTIAGQPFGGLFAGWFGLSSPLWIYAGACLISAVVFGRTIHDPERRDGGVRKASLRSLPWGRPFVTALVVNGAYMWMVGAVYSTLIPLFGNERVGLPLSSIGFGLAISSATEFAALFPAGKATDRVGRKAVLVPSYAALALIVVSLGVAIEPLPFMLGLAALGVASGYASVPPAVMLSDVTPEGSRGTAVGAFRFAGDLGFVLGPLVAGYAASSLGFGAAFVLSAVPVLLALTLALSIRETMPLLPRTGEAAGL